MLRTNFFEFVKKIDLFLELYTQLIDLIKQSKTRTYANMLVIYIIHIFYLTNTFYYESFLSR